MPDIESPIDTVGGAKFITECDIRVLTGEYL